MCSAELDGQRGLVSEGNLVVVILLMVRLKTTTVIDFTARFTVFYFIGEARRSAIQQMEIKCSDTDNHGMNFTYIEFEHTKFYSGTFIMLFLVDFIVIYQFFVDVLAA